MAEVLSPDYEKRHYCTSFFAADTQKPFHGKGNRRGGGGRCILLPLRGKRDHAGETFVRGFQSYLRQNAERIALNGGTDEVAAVSALGYDAYMTMVTALESLDGTKDVLTSVDLRNALYEVDYEGVTGDIS